MLLNSLLSEILIFRWSSNSNVAFLADDTRYGREREASERPGLVKCPSHVEWATGLPTSHEAE